MSECDRGVCELDSLQLVVLLWVLVAWHEAEAGCSQLTEFRKW